MTIEEQCGEMVVWWGGEYEGYCELPLEHEGDHFDGQSWWDDERTPKNEEHSEP